MYLTRLLFELHTSVTCDHSLYQFEFVRKLIWYSRESPRTQE